MQRMVTTDSEQSVQNCRGQRELSFEEIEQEVRVFQAQGARAILCTLAQMVEDTPGMTVKAALPILEDELSFGSLVALQEAMLAMQV